MRWKNTESIFFKNPAEKLLLISPSWKQFFQPTIHPHQRFLLIVGTPLFFLHQTLKKKVGGAGLRGYCKIKKVERQAAKGDCQKKILVRVKERSQIIKKLFYEILQDFKNCFNIVFNFSKFFYKFIYHFLTFYLAWEPHRFSRRS